MNTKTIGRISPSLQTQQNVGDHNVDVDSVGNNVNIVIVNDTVTEKVITGDNELKTKFEIHDPKPAETEPISLVPVLEERSLIDPMSIMTTVGVMEKGVSQHEEKKSTHSKKLFKELHFSDFRLPKWDRFNSRIGKSHGQLVEEPCSPVNTLEREQAAFKESLEHNANFRHRRTGMERLRSFAARARKSMSNLATCMANRGNRDNDASVRYNKGTHVELPPDITSVTNEVCVYIYA
ncbi:hypothetical protein SNE40_004342 [Patella caerulea]|uniref:Uncharacterized protein n=1 Tax=Patella caerulea TaxID=87958 RepID=A0AAN8Q0R1_PATCE